MAQGRHERRGDGARLLGAAQQKALDLFGVRHQVLVALAHRADLGVDALEQRLLGVAPGDAVGKRLRKGRGLGIVGEGAVDLVQRRAFGVLGLARCARIGHDAHDLLAQLLARPEQGDGVVVALAHLAAVQAGQQGHVVVDQRLGRHQVFTVQVVEAGRHVARHLDVLDLVAPHRHVVGLEHQDVGTHQHRVHEQAGADVAVRVGTRGGVLVQHGLVGVGAVQQALAGDAGEQPGQLRDLGDVGLAVEGHVLRVQSGGQPAGGDLERAALDARRLVALDERVVVGQEIEALHARLAAGAHRRADGADVVAQVRGAGGGDAGEDAGSHLQ